MPFKLTLDRIRTSVFCLALGCFTTGCGVSDETPEARDKTAPEVEAVMAEPVSRPLIQSYPGRLAAFRKAEVRARAAGILLQRNYEEGREVAAGDLLFSIDDAQLKINVQSAESSLAKAEAEHQGTLDTLGRLSTLLNRQSINEHDHVASVTAEKRARAEVAGAAAALAEARLKLSYARVTAPIGGRAGQELVSEGTLVGEDGLTPLTTIEQIDPIYVNFSQPAQDLITVKILARRGDLREYPEDEVKVQLVLPDGNLYDHEGRLAFADAAVDPETDNITMKALFPNPDRVLLPGAYIQVNLIRAENPRVFLAPREALERGEDSSHIYLVSPENIVEKREVQARELEGKNWLVTSGLDDGERIIVNSSQAAPLPGRAVTFTPPPSAEAAPSGTPARN